VLLYRALMNFHTCCFKWDSNPAAIPRQMKKMLGIVQVKPEQVSFGGWAQAMSSSPS